MGKTIKWGIFVMFVLALVVQPLLGQATGRGEVRGVVRDQNQAVIPGADVTVTNQNTNFTQVTLTSEVGAYFIGAVPIGSYSLKIEMPGFNTWTTEFVLQAGSTATIDAELQVGDIATTIEVTDSVSEVSIDRLEISDVKDFDRIQQLPLNGREVGALFSLTPGVEGGAGGARVLGQKVGSLDITLDGVSMVDRNGGGLRARIVPRIDLIQEFRVETLGSDARFANPSTVTMVSRSGTNEIHGSVFYTHRNNTAGLRARRRNEYSSPSKYLRHEWGATVGGPLWLGNLYDGRDKTFWFFNYEGQRAYTTRFTNQNEVPLPHWFEGDFSDLVDGNEVPITIYNPYTSRPDGTRDAFPGNQVPQSLFHPFRETMKSITAAPNLPTNPALGNNFEYYYPRSEPSRSLNFKVDQVLSDSDNLSVRYTWLTGSLIGSGGRYASPPPGRAVSELGCCGGSERNSNNMHNVSINWNRTMSAQLLNEFLVGVNRVYHSRGTMSDYDTWGTTLGLPNPFNANGWPTFSAGNYASWDADNLITQPSTHVTAEDNLTWVRGDHVLQFGGKVKIAHTNNAQLQQAQGSHSFSDDWTGLWNPDANQQVSRTGEGLASALMGLGTNFSNQLNRGFFYYRQNEFNFYVNDKWKVNPRMTVNLGLRWDSWTPYREKLGRSVMIDEETLFDPIFQVVTPTGTRIEDMGLPAGLVQGWANRGLTWKTADQVPGMPDTLWAADWNNFGPRLGISYMLTDKTVLRGSYGEYYWTMPLEQLLASARSIPPLNNRYRNEPNNKDGSGNYALRAVPDASDELQNIVVQTEGLVQVSSGAGYQMQQDGRTWKDSKARTWHLTLEHEVMRNTALRVSYTGTQGRSFEQKRNNNDQAQHWNYVTQNGVNPLSGNAANSTRPSPDWDGRMAVDKTGYSNSHAGQIEIERRFSDGIGFQAFYVYNHTIITADGGGFSHGGGVINANNGTQQAPSFINLYQVPNPVSSYFTSSPSADELRKLAYINTYNIPPHRFRFNGIVDLPFGRGKRVGTDVSNGINQVIGGWQIAFIGDWRSGMYRSINTGKGVFGDYTIDPGDRPKIQIFGKDQIVWFKGDFDPTSCTANCDGLTDLVNPDRSQRVLRPYGTSFNNRLPITLNDGTVRQTDVMGSRVFWPFAKNNWMGPRSWNLDLSLFKHFSITEDVTLRFTADFFNFFNHPNNSDPNTSTGLLDLTGQSNEPRTIQFSLALRF